MLPYATGTERQTCSDEDDRICHRVVEDRHSHHDLWNLTQPILRERERR
jgi:hypothetical protein